MVPHLILLLLLSIASSSSSSLSGTESAAATFTLTNNCAETIWPVTTPDLPSPASPLPPREARTVPVPTGWSGRIWGRTHSGKAEELRLDGTQPPDTAVELTVGEGLDFYYGESSVDEGSIPVLVRRRELTRSNPDEMRPTAAREEGSVAGNYTTTTHTDYLILFCTTPESSSRIRRGGPHLTLYNKKPMSKTTRRRRNSNDAFSSAAAIEFTESATTSNPVNHQESIGYGGDNETAMTTMMEPVKTVEMRMLLNDKRRRLNSFQMCALCTCCGGGGGGSRHYCLLSPCCYAINCNIPNKPFGFCSFTPKACNCFGCRL